MKKLSLLLTAMLCLLAMPVRAANPSFSAFDPTQFYVVGSSRLGVGTGASMTNMIFCASSGGTSGRVTLILTNQFDNHLELQLTPVNSDYFKILMNVNNVVFSWSDTNRNTLGFMTLDTNGVFFASGGLTGDGSGITGITAAQISGLLPSSNIFLLNAVGQIINGNTTIFTNVPTLTGIKINQADTNQVLFVMPLGVDSTSNVLNIVNPAAAASGAGNQSWSGGINMRGFSWNTTSSASQPVDIRQNVDTFQGTLPSGAWTLRASTNQVNYGAPLFTVKSDGTTGIAGLLTASNGITTPAGATVNLNGTTSFSGGLSIFGGTGLPNAYNGEFLTTGAGAGFVMVNGGTNLTGITSLASTQLYTNITATRHQEVVVTTLTVTTGAAASTIALVYSWTNNAVANTYTALAASSAASAGQIQVPVVTMDVDGNTAVSVAATVVNGPPTFNYDCTLSRTR